jgi:hypothetical protein
MVTTINRYGLFYDEKRAATELRGDLLAMPKTRSKISRSSAAATVGSDCFAWDTRKISLTQ